MWNSRRQGVESLRGSGREEGLRGVRLRTKGPRLLQERGVRERKSGGVRREGIRGD